MGRGATQALIPLEMENGALVLKERWWFLMKFVITSLEYPAILPDFPPPLVQDGIWVWGVGKPSPGGRNGQEPGARSGPYGEASVKLPYGEASVKRPYGEASREQTDDR